MAETASKTFTTTIEPVKSCNMSCRYCYSDIHDGGIMGEEILNLSLKRIIDYAEQNGFAQIHFIWHGGEPLLAGIDFFKQAVEILYKLNSDIPCQHFIQTNGLLIDDNYCSFFKENEFEVGVSLDGPADIHDRFRTSQDGTGTYRLVLEKIHLIEKHNMPFGFCAVVSRISIGHERRIFRFFRNLGHGFRVNPLIPSGHTQKTRRYLFKEGEYGKFLCCLLDEWVSGRNQRMMVSPLDVYLRSILNGEPVECQYQSSCAGSHIGIKPDGRTVLCCRFEDHVTGNIQNMTIQEIFSSAFCKDVKKRADKLYGCHSCKNWSVCHGGCPHNVLSFGLGLMERDPFCSDYKMIFSYIRQKLEKLNNADKRQVA